MALEDYDEPPGSEQLLPQRPHDATRTLLNTLAHGSCAAFGATYANHGWLGLALATERIHAMEALPTTAVV